MLSDLVRVLAHSDAAGGGRAERARGQDPLLWPDGPLALRRAHHRRPVTDKNQQGWKFMSCSHSQEFRQKASWRLIG